MEQGIISQYTSLKRECEEIQQSIGRLEDRKRDLLKCITANPGHCHLVPEYVEADIAETEYLINKNIGILHNRKKRVDELIIAIEEYIDCVDDSRIRRMISLKYIEGKTWYQVAQAMGRYYTQDSCKKQVHRYLRSE